MPAGILAKFPVKTHDIELDHLGYAGWWIRVRINPKVKDYEALLIIIRNDPDHPKWRIEDTEKEWKAFGNIILEWNIKDEDGNPMPYIKDGLKKEDFYIDIWNELVTEYFVAFRDASRPPKQLEGNLNGTSSTSTSLPTNDEQ